MLGWTARAIQFLADAYSSALFPKNAEESKPERSLCAKDKGLNTEKQYSHTLRNVIM